MSGDRDITEGLLTDMEIRRHELRAALRGWLQLPDDQAGRVDALILKIWRLWNRLVREQQLADGKHAVRRRFECRLRELAEEQAYSDTSGDLQVHARLVRLKKLERCNVSRARAVEAAARVGFAELRPKEKAEARRRTRSDWKSGGAPRARRSKIEPFVQRVVKLLEKETRRKIGYSTYPLPAKGSAVRAGTRTGPEFRVIQAAVAYVGLRTSPETLVRAIRAAHAQ